MLNKIDIQKSKKYFTFSYLLALFLIALLSCSGYILIQISINRQALDASVINLSGRQRALSQKLAKEVLLVVLSNSPELKEDYRKKLSATVDIWSQVHIGLQHGNGKLGLPGNNSPEVKRIFAEMEPYYQTMISRVEKILALEPIKLTQLSSDSNLVQDIVKTSPLFLQWMDKVAFQYTEEAEMRVDSLKRYETGIILMILLLLTIEALFIFRPMIKRILEAFGSFQQTNEQLEQEISKRKQAIETLQKTSDILKQEVKEHNKNKERLVEERKKLDDIVNDLHAGLAVVDMNMNVVWVNALMEKWYGPHEKIFGTKCYQVYSGINKICEDCLLEKSFKKGEIVHASKTELTKDGRERSLSITSMPVKNKEGKIIHGLLLIQDVTDKIKLEKKLARAESLAMVGEIAAGVAHEIRNPLESIVSASSLLSSENPNITREDHAKLTDVVKSESQRLNKLLTDFLDFTRPKEPKLNINNINELIEEVLSFSKYGEILNDGIRLRKNLDPTMTAIPIDGDMIKQVLWNIILNALQAMEKGGDLSIDSKLCEETIEVCITDSGPGVSKKEMEKLFVPFYTKRKGGTGLGLSIANRIINAHNGSIKLERTRKQGLKFTITLPKS